MIKVNVKKEEDIAIIEVEGEIDLNTSDIFRENLYQVIDEGYKKLVISLDKVNYIDSTGLGILIGGLKKMRLNNGRLTVVCSHPQIRKVFTITGLADILGLHENLQQAIDHLQRED